MNAIARDRDEAAFAELCQRNRSRSIALSFARISIDEIEVESLQSKELPEFLKDIPQTIKELGAEVCDPDEQGNLTHTAGTK